MPNNFRFCSVLINLLLYITICKIAKLVKFPSVQFQHGSTIYITDSCLWSGARVDGEVVSG